MRKSIRILEVPLYLLVIAMFCYQNGSSSMAIFLTIISIIRLWVNHITDDIINKKNGYDKKI